MIDHIHREITPLNEDDCFLIIDRTKNSFNFPIHFHPEFEINYIFNAKGGRRIVGDHIGEIGDMELVLTGPNLFHGWENYNSNSSKIQHEITIQFSQELFGKSFLVDNPTQTLPPIPMICCQ